MTKKLVPDPPTSSPVPIAGHDLNHFEMQLSQVYDVLRCATAIAYECADNLQGQPRDLAMGSMHLIGHARKMVHDLLDQLQPVVPDTDGLAN
ncbi:hypothetical protein NJC40_01360 [Pseudomonas sp. 21LCFQ02]|uniref:DUF6124 family protein n=1 Tax=unclassified Pseudomonas TaxID=196821 RepID=UPI00209A7823|nr:MULTISPECIES: hypothetical protein [unclassified Pseudomonas]MCO8166424.1 hypothetical protein [Pseudomonas sp. 21LCFQ02]MCQ9422556.1 hypothetical protein [Pseudomonas sp. LJDD11]